MSDPLYVTQQKYYASEKPKSSKTLFIGLLRQVRGVHDGDERAEGPEAAQQQLLLGGRGPQGRGGRQDRSRVQQTAQPGP